ncbi:MAG TPA: discoidin domain-containing protein [Polyangiaceae bacterium]
MENTLTCTLTPPPGTPPSLPLCGDSFRTSFEQCDDGNTANGDACSSQCTVTPLLIAPPSTSNSALPPPARELGSGRHPLAAGCNTVGVAFIDYSISPPALKLATFSNTGIAGPIINFGSANVDDAAPVVAGLPDDTFAVAWTDFDGDSDELGVQLRKLNPDPHTQTQASPMIANSSTGFSQSAPDIVFDGNELVVAWVDNTDPVNGPDLRYRLFDPITLAPKSDDSTLAATSAVETDVALAALNGNWAAAWRSASGGSQTIEIQSGTAHWSVGPFAPGADGDRPAIEFVDATHLALAFTEGTDPTLSGIANTPRLYGAILDAAFPGVTSPFAIAPITQPYASTPTISQTEPALAAFSDRVLVGWRSSAIPGDPLGDELWTRELKWTIDGNTLNVDASSPEVPLFGSAFHAGDQSNIALLSSPLWPEHRLFSAWEDYGRTFHSTSGAPVSGGPDVALQLSNAPTTDAANTRFPLSDDGNYYKVNVLRRSHLFPAPQASATFSNGARVSNLGSPPNMFDESDVSFRWTTPVSGGTNGANPNATVVAVINLGRVVQIGALRQYFADGLVRTPISFQLRLGQTQSQLTTIIPQTVYTTSDTISEFASTPAQYVELTFVGTGDFGQIDLTELFLYPSADTSPPPSTADGYDLTYLPNISNSPQTVNLLGFNGTLFDKLVGGFQGRTVAQGANGDGVVTIDLGGWYAISDVGLAYRLSQGWPAGGSVEISSDNVNWTAVTNVARGSAFGPPSGGGLQLITFPQQTARYVRITDYFVPGVGTSVGRLDEVQVF